MKFPPEYIWAREDWNRPRVLDDFLPQLKDWSFDLLDVPKIIHNVEHIFEFPMIDRDPLPKWTHGNITLQGDAAHPMYPIVYNGATQAILDARILARKFQTMGVIAAALQAYDTKRRAVTAAIVLGNQGDGPDKSLDVVAKRAPNRFARVEDVLTKAELESTATAYKKTAGMDIEELNNRPSTISSSNQS